VREEGEALSDAVWVAMYRGRLSLITKKSDWSYWNSGISFPLKYP